MNLKELENKVNLAYERNKELKRENLELRNKLAKMVEIVEYYRKKLAENTQNIEVENEEKGEKMRLKAALISALKNAITVIIAGLAAIYGNSPWYLLIAPLLKFMEKYLTVKEV